MENIGMLAEAGPYVKRLQAEVTRINTENGWFDSFRHFDADVALLHSEVSEAYEAYRDKQFDFTFDENGKPIGIPSELADIFIRLLDTCERRGIDLVHVTLKKLAYNETRGYRHGGKLT